MRWFEKKQTSRFPADMLRRLEQFGRAEFDPQSGGIDTSLYGQWLVARYHESQADPEGFLADLGALVVGDQGGFATYGAARLVWECFGTQGMRMPAALPLIDGGIDFKLARNLPGGRFTGYEYSRLSERRAASGGS